MPDYGSVRGFGSRMATKMRVRLELELSRREKRHEAIKTFCLIVGPYRNLTTLTSALLAMHPQTQVLNHGARRILGRKPVDFFANPGPSIVDRFLQYGIYIAAGGRRGDFGGSILLSHAFDNEDVRRLYEERFGTGNTKWRCESFIWKESMKVTNILMGSDMDVDRLLSNNPRLRLLLPIRNPLNCARSNMATGHAQYIGNNEKEMYSIISGILDAYQWFGEVCQRHPRQCMWFTQDDVHDRNLYKELAAFLDVDPSEQWMDDCEHLARLRESAYSHEWAVVRYYQQAVMERFSDDDAMGRKLIGFGP